MHPLVVSKVAMCRVVDCTIVHGLPVSAAQTFDVSAGMRHILCCLWVNPMCNLLPVCRALAFLVLILFTCFASVLQVVNPASLAGAVLLHTSDHPAACLLGCAVEAQDQ